MAKFIPSLKEITNKGERKVANVLQKLLEDDYLCWHDIPVGNKYQHPDFVILNPRRGILVLEVKAWKLETLRKIDKMSWEIWESFKPKTVINPLEQARQYAHAISNQMSKDAVLKKQEGKYQGQLLFPWGYGVVFSEITRKEFKAYQLQEVIPADRVICADELSLQQDPEVFQQRLWNMFTVAFPVLLSLPQVERIRWHLFPEIRIDHQQGSLISAIETDNPQTLDDIIPEIVRVMDLNQEQIARNMGEGHRVIHGVAGSGKTMILAYRCIHLAKIVQKPILVLCFNKSLAEHLQRLIITKTGGDKVQVCHFHKWYKIQAELYQVDLPKSTDYEETLSLEIASVINAVDSGQIPCEQYSAVFIDEGHDFKAEWFKLVVKMIDPATNSLLVCYDDAQNIYRKTKFTFSSVGIKAQGRTTILSLNYRNTYEITNFAHYFISQWLQEHEIEKEDDIPLISPESVNRHGNHPTFIACKTINEERNNIVSFLNDRYENLQSWQNIAVLFYANKDCDYFVDYLKKYHPSIPAISKNKPAKKSDGHLSYLRVMTLHSSKGLEFDSIAIGNISKPHPNTLIEDDAKIYYVGMTRAMNHLLLTSCKDSELVNRLKHWQDELSM